MGGRGESGAAPVGGRGSGYYERRKKGMCVLYQREEKRRRTCRLFCSSSFFFSNLLILTLAFMFVTCHTSKNWTGKNGGFLNGRKMNSYICVVYMVSRAWFDSS